MEAFRSVGLEYVSPLFDLADALRLLSNADEAQCPSCGARWPAPRMQSAGDVYGDGKRTVTFCLQTCSTMRWTRPALGVLLEHFGVLSENSAHTIAIEAVD